MATRAEIKESVIGQLVREETTDTQLNSWFRRATQRIEQELRIAAMVASTGPVNIVGGAVPTPADFLAPLDVRLVTAANTRGGPLIYATPATWDAWQARSDLAGRVPGYFTRIGPAIKFTPWATSAAVAASIDYYAKLPTLGVHDDDRNWLTDSYEDLFCNAVLIYGHRHYFEDDRSLLKEGLVQGECARLNKNYMEDKVGDGPLVMAPGRRFGGRHS